MSDRLKIIYNDDPPDRQGPSRFQLIAAGCAVLTALLLLGSIDSPIGNPAELPAPPRIAIAVMPDLVGSSLIGAGNRLADVGLDREVMDRARWIANAEVAVGTVSAQIPKPGSEVFDYAEIELVLSSGGPTITWDQMPPTMQNLQQQVGPTPVDEPILVLNTEAGSVYKTDDLLLGGCTAIDLTKDSFYDRTFDKVCQPPGITPLVGWLGDGAMYAIDGLPEQNYLDVGSAISLGPDEPMGRQLWSMSALRRAPGVEVDDRTVRVTGGFYRFALKIPEDSALSPEEVAGLIVPSDIRGNLVVDLSPPLSFYAKPGIAGSNAPAGYTARRHRQVPGEPFSAWSTVNIVSSRDDLEVSVDDRYSDRAKILTVPATRWSNRTLAGWQFAYPSDWITSDSYTDEAEILAVATHESTEDATAPCGRSPVAAIRNMGVRDVVLSVTLSQGQPTRQWPTYFDDGDLGPIVPGYGSSCLSGVNARIRVETLSYEGRSLEVVSAFGPEADEGFQNQALAILTSLEPGPQYSDG